MFDEYSCGALVYNYINSTAISGTEVADYLGEDYNIVFKTFAKKRFSSVAKEWGCTRPLDDKPYF